MGKTASGAVWLNADQLSPYDYWQFWRNTGDADVVRFLRLFTDVSLQRIDELAKLEGQSINDAKIELANAATALLHGEEAATSAAATAQNAFSGGGGEDLPSFAVGNGATISAMLIGLGFVASNGEAKRKIAEGAVRVDGEVVSDPQAIVEAPARVSLGKKKHGLVTR